MEELKKTIERFIREHGMKQKEVHNLVRKIYINISDGFGKTHVLYCNSYGGGYNLSDSLTEYINVNRVREQEGGVLSNRVKTARIIGDYGKHMLRYLPGLENALYNYIAFDFDFVMRKVRAIVYHKMRAVNMETIRGVLGDKNAVFGCCDDVDLEWHPDHFVEQVKRYSEKSLIKTLAEGDPPTTAVGELQAHLSKHNIGYIYNDLVNTCYTMIYTDIKLGGGDSPTVKGFEQEVGKSGYRNAAVWTLQERFDQYGMRYILIWVAVNGEDKDKDILERVYVEYGLICGGKGDCRLDMCEIPALTEWMICEYDGRETVRTI